MQRGLGVFRRANLFRPHTEAVFRRGGNHFLSHFVFGLPWVRFPPPDRVLGFRTSTQSESGLTSGCKGVGLLFDCTKWIL